MAEIMRIEDKWELCKDCNGLCRQHTNGYYEVVSSTSTGLFHCTMQMCDHERARQEQRRLNRLVQSCGIPPAYKGKTFDNYIVSEGAENAVKVALRASRAHCFTGLQGQARRFWRRLWRRRR